jgi:hypothetical protein
MTRLIEYVKIQLIKPIKNNFAHDKIQDNI